MYAVHSKDHTRHRGLAGRLRINFKGSVRLGQSLHESLFKEIQYIAFIPREKYVQPQMNTPSVPKEHSSYPSVLSLPCMNETIWYFFTCAFLATSWQHRETTYAFAKVSTPSTTNKIRRETMHPPLPFVEKKLAYFFF